MLVNIPFHPPTFVAGRNCLQLLFNFEEQLENCGAEHAQRRLSPREQKNNSLSSFPSLISFPLFLIYLLRFV